MTENFLGSDAENPILVAELSKSQIDSIIAGNVDSEQSEEANEPVRNKRRLPGYRKVSR